MTGESDDAAVRPITRTSVTSGEEWAPDWVIRLPDLSSVAVPDDQKDEFTHRVLEAIRTLSGHGTSGETVSVGLGSRVHEWRLNTADGRPRPRLWILNRHNALQFFLAGHDEPVAEDVAAWRTAVDTALSCIGSLKNHRWMAILSEVGTSMPTGPSQLAAPASVSGLDLRILDGCVAEDQTVTPPFGVGRYVHQRFHWPLRVEGTTSCYAWDEDGQRRALERLRHVTAILSLAWDSCWAVREGPRPPDATFADARQPLMGRSWEPVPADSPLAAGRSVTAPAWLADAERLTSGGAAHRVLAALLMHHEGMLVEADHPSLALVCYIASIESVAPAIGKPEACAACGAVPGVAAKRFRAAIASVLPPEAATELSKAYGPRSRTVHAAQTFGHERTCGLSPMSLFLPDSGLAFAMGTVISARRASRAMLLRELAPEGVNGSVAGP